MYYVYQIKIKETIRYIGYTNDPQKREKQHNYLCFKVNKSKKLYDNIKTNSEEKEIKLSIIKVFNNKVDAKRYECFLILSDYFDNKNLWQHIPKINDM